MKAHFRANCCFLMGMLFAIIIPLSSFSQNARVTGTVKVAAEGTALQGVSISIKNTKNTTVSNSDGTFSIDNVPGNAVLLFSYVGFATKEVPIQGKTSVSVVLDRQEAKMDEVVVIGYGTQKKSQFAGAASTVNVERDRIDEIPVESLDKALQGKIAGVQIRDVGGEIGQTPDINIRGVSSFSASTRPLIVIDGLPTSATLSDVSMNDIASISVLKDAASTAIYGSRGANGVILVTTKQGTKDKMKFSVKLNTGTSNVYKYYNTFQDYEEFARNEYRKYIAPWESDFLRAGLPVPQGTNANGTAVVSPAGKTYLSWENYFSNKLNPATGTVYDFNGAGYNNVHRLNQLLHPKTPQESVTQTGIKKSAFVSAKGGTDKTSFYLSASYDDIEGVMINNMQKAVSVTATIKSRLKDNLRVEMSIMPRVKTSQFGSNAQMGGGLRWLTIPLTYDPLSLKTVLQASEGGYVSPTVQVGDFVKSRDFSRTWLMNDDFSNYVLNSAGQKIRVLTYSQTAGTTSYSDAFETDDTRDEYVFTGNFAVNWDILKNLTLRTTVGAFVKYDNRDLFVGSFKNSAGVATSGFGRATYTNSLYRNIINENTLSYSKKIKQHNFNVLAGLSEETGKTTGLQVGGNFFSDDDIRSLSTAREITPTAAANPKSDETLLSVYGRLNYDYDGKYILSASMRRDGSSKFGPDNRWGSFPSASVAWNLSRESFLGGLAGKVDDLRIRFSYGVTGNNRILSYAYTTAVNSANYTFGTTITSGSAANGSTIGNASIGWEQTNAANLGLSAEFFKKRISLNVDVYNNKTKSLLLQTPIVNITGHDFEWRNIGQVQNKGIEVEIGTVNIRTKRMNWNTNANFSMTKNKLLNYGNAQEQFFAGYQNSAYRMKVGSPLGEFYGFKTNGEIWKTSTEIQSAIAKGTALVNTVPGDLKLQDTNGDGIITDADKTSLGDVYPTFEFGLTNSFSYKNLDVSFSVQGSIGSKVWNFSNIFGYCYLRWLNEDSFVDEFHGSVPNGGSTSISGTDYYIEDASFVALRDVSVGYKLPKQKLRLFFSGRNLLYLMSKGYHGVNPEFMANISGNLIRGRTTGNNHRIAQNINPRRKP